MGGMSVGCGREFAVLVDEEGSLWLVGRPTWFETEEEEINQPNFFQIANSPQVEEVACGYGHVLSLDTNGHLFSFGSNSEGQLGLGHFDCVSQPTRVEVPRVRHISACDHISFLLDQDGCLFFSGVLERKLWRFGNRPEMNLTIRTKFERFSTLVDLVSLSAGDSIIA